jgi:gamma-glutamylcyclotransferase (GGCT)/AIG2-like uncharacterized protein YtfP
MYIYVNCICVQVQISFENNNITWLNNVNQLYVLYLCITNPFKVASLNLVHGEVYSIQHYVIKLFNDLGQVGGFLRVLQFPPDSNSQQ